MQRLIPAALLAATCVATAYAQAPQPFPRPDQAAAGRTAPTAPAAQSATAPAPAQPGAPTSATLGVSIYPGAQFLASYDAGREQRYYLFGTSGSFAEVVAYYRAHLDERGNLVYEQPATHMFTGGPLGRYREETMAFPPSVTVKDWSGERLKGYPHPQPGAEPARFPTVIMIVPPPAGVPAR